MSEITRNDVLKVARLSRLKLSETEVDLYTSQLGKILKYVDQLNEVPTDGIEPMAHPLELSNVFREDIEHPSLPRERALSNSPQTDGRYFLVPPILEDS